MSEVIAVIDRVDDGEYEGKPHKKILTKAGETFKIGQRLSPKWNILKPGTPIWLIMDNYKGNEYVKDIDACYDVAMDRVKELSQPAAKNPRDISIERQVAVKCTCDLMAAKVEIPEDIQTMTLEWIRSALK
jgi:hypothetical protein